MTTRLVSFVIFSQNRLLVTFERTRHYTTGMLWWKEQHVEITEELYLRNNPVNYLKEHPPFNWYHYPGGDEAHRDSEFLNEAWREYWVKADIDKVIAQ